VNGVARKDVKYGVLAANGNDGMEVHRLGIRPPHMLVKHFTK
jgi:hypothetical protein